MVSTSDYDSIQSLLPLYKQSRRWLCYTRSWNTQTLHKLKALGNRTNKTMKLVQAIASLLFLIVCSTPTSNASITTIHDVCQCVVKEDHNPDEKHTISYHDCVKFFQADDKESAIADKYGLAAIGVKNVGATAKSITYRIAHLRASEKDKERLGCLGECAKWYKYADDKIGEAAKGIASGTKGGQEDAELALIRAMYAPLICEERFEKIHKPSPLATEDAKFYKEAVITKFVTGHCSLDV
ncbi:hypothetical protein HU200_063250 [Digitaria exilis]|uniref:Pectinesterase inhibitor domain-containing protein n=1 Tax=Digitaria exilis TaxID=1010633 RepID=A0A835A1W9_9POAL|nr:hypothetical protein HU200_063250 [Digitaria exilis]